MVNKKERVARQELFSKGLKKCAKCKQAKDLKDFYKKKASSDGYHPQCKKCVLNYIKSEKYKHLVKKRSKTEKVKTYHRKWQREWRRTEKGKQHTRRNNQKRANDPEYIAYRKKYDRARQQTPQRKEYERQRNKLGHRKSYQKEHRHSEHGKQLRKKYSAVRRTLSTQAGGTYTTAEWYALCEFYSFHCLMCDHQFPFDKLTVDHVKPVSKGGTSFIWNLQPLCKSCNSRKRAKEIDYRQTLPNWIKRERENYHQLSLF